MAASERNTSIRSGASPLGGDWSSATIFRIPMCLGGVWHTELSRDQIIVEYCVYKVVRGTERICDEVGYIRTCLQRDSVGGCNFHIRDFTVLCLHICPPHFPFRLKKKRQDNGWPFVYSVLFLNQNHLRMLSNDEAELFYAVRT